MTHSSSHNSSFSRRHLFRQTGVNLGRMALGSLLLGSAPSLLRGEDTSGGILAAKKPHFAPKAKRVIHLFMAGAPSH